MIRNTSTTRRTVLSGIATGTAVAASGCLSGSSETGQSESGDDSDEYGGIFDAVFVDGMDLVLELTEESSVDHVNVIDPAGELFAERTIPTGVRRETIELGTSYSPGDYEIVALEDEEEQTTRSLTIEPAVRIADLRLGQNHPDEMFEGATERETRNEVILTLKNEGTGPDAATRLSFQGHIPRQTPDEDTFEESGLYDTEDEISRHADSIDLPPNEEVIVYSYRRPFSAATERVSCTPDTEHGEFDVIVETAVQDAEIVETYEVSYTGEDLIECDIEVEKS